MDLHALKPAAEKIFEDIRVLSWDGVGVTRASYGPGETATAVYLRRFAESHGLVVSTDAAANLLFRQPSLAPDARAVWTGSHLDSVPRGGNFDGLAGIVAGLLCLVAHQQAGTCIALCVIAFRGEESAWFGKAYMGSAAAFGLLSANDLQLRHRSGDRTLGDYMAQAGADTLAVTSGRPLIDKALVAAYLELHIEQGPVMVARHLPLAVVSGIRGNVRHNRVRCIGEAGHSGAVPRWLRRDAMFAVADLIMRLDEHWRAMLERGMDLVVTTGIVGTDAAEHSISRIPGTVDFSFEARSRSQDTLEAFHALMQAECDTIGQERGVRFEFDRRLLSAPATMDDHVISVLSQACTQQGVAFDVIASGAGHDAAVLANAGIPSGMLFIRNANGSHNPNEAMDLDDFMPGVAVIAAAAKALA